MADYPPNSRSPGKQPPGPGSISGSPYGKPTEVPSPEQWQGYGVGSFPRQTTRQPNAWVIGAIAVGVVIVIVFMMAIAFLTGRSTKPETATETAPAETGVQAPTPPPAQTTPAQRTGIKREELRGFSIEIPETWQVSERGTAYLIGPPGETRITVLFGYGGNPSVFVPSCPTTSAEFPTADPDATSASNEPIDTTLPPFSEVGGFPAISELANEFCPDGTIIPYGHVYLPTVRVGIGFDPLDSATIPAIESIEFSDPTGIGPTVSPR